MDLEDPSQAPLLPPPDHPSEDGHPSDGDVSFPSELRTLAGAPCAAKAPLFLGKYRLLRQLGRGGMGVVYAAEHIHSGATVAIKMLPAKDPALGDRLLRESRALARLAHPKIVQLFDSGVTDEGDYYIIMEHVPGVNLRALMQKAIKMRRRLPMRLVLAVMLQTAEAMASTHAVSIVHRDIKPENIIVTKLGRAKLVDFGLAKHSGAVAPANVLGAASDPAHVPGTPRYMAPEQVNGDDIDGRTDVYAIGVVLYEVVCGRTPYGDDPTTASAVVMGHHLFAPPKPIHDFAPDCPDDVCAIILRCLQKDPARRYQSADELATALKAALERCMAQARAVRAMGRVVRVTEPMPEVREVRPVLPFVSPKPLPATVAAPVSSEIAPPEDEEVTLTRGTMLPGPAAPEPPVAPAPAPPAALAPAPPATPSTTPSAATAPAAAAPAPAATSAPAPSAATVPAAAAPAPPVASAPTLPTVSPPAPSAATTPAAAAPAGEVALAPPATPGSATTQSGVTVETAAPPAPGPVKPLADAAPVARRKWTMNAPPYSVAALGGVVAALVLSFGLFGGVKKGDAQEPNANRPVALSAAPAPAPPPKETATVPAPRPPQIATASAPLPTETIAPASPPTETAAPAPPPLKPVAIRVAAPAPSVAQPLAVQHKPRELPEGRMVSGETATQPINPAPPASTPPPPPAEPDKAPHRIFGSEQ